MSLSYRVDQLEMPPPMNDVIDAYDLSPQQARLWKRPEQGSSYRSWLVIRMRGQLDIQELTRALGYTVGVQETLRTRFLETEEGPVQVIDEQVETSLNRLDLRRLAPGKQQEAVSSFLEDRARRSSDRALGGQPRLALAQIAEQAWLLICDLPTVLADTWSLVQLFEQLAGSYGVRRQLAAHEKPMPYAQFSAWQRQLLELEETAEDRDHWQSRADLPLRHFALPLERSRKGEPTGMDVASPGANDPQGAEQLSRDGNGLLPPHRVIRHLGREQIRRLEHHASTLGLPEEAFLLMGWSLLIARSLGNPEVVLTRLSRGRAYEELDKSIGLFEKNLPAVQRIQLDSSYLAGVRSWAREIEEGEDWQEYFDSQLLDREVNEIGTSQGTAHPSLALGFDFCVCPMERIATDVQFSLAGLSCRVERLRLRLSCRRLATGLRLEIEGDPRSFDAVDLGRLGERLETLLEGALIQPHYKAEALPLLGESERLQVVSTFNRTETVLAPAISEGAGGQGEFLLHRYIEMICRDLPDQTAVVFEGTSLTYGELDTRAENLASQLQAMGAGPEVLVGICLERSLELVVVLLAVLKSGAAYLPLDPFYPSERLELMVRDSRAVLCIAATLDGVAAIFPRHRVLVLSELGLEEAEEATRNSESVSTEGELQRIETTCSEADSSEFASSEFAGWESARGAAISSSEPVSPEPVSTETIAANAAYVIYTSGSTGVPKGAINTHAAVVNRLIWMRDALGVGPDDVILQKTPLSFDVSVWELFLPLMVGARLVLARPEGHREPKYLAQLMSDEKVTMAHFVPSLLDVFLVEPGIEDLHSVRHLICSGEALSPQLRDRCLQRMDSQLYNLYGPTEAAIDVTAARCRLQEPTEAVSIGRPIANLKTFVLSPEAEVVPVGVSGELHIAGAGLARGYLGRPALTASRFVPDATSGLPGSRLYRTGDLARWSSNGSLMFQGRGDDQLKVRGFRIEPGEVVAVLERHPEVRTTVVQGRKDSPMGLRLVAYIVPTPGARISAGRGGGALLEADGRLDIPALRSFLGKALPLGMIPAEFVLLTALPLLPNGKLDRQALPSPQRPVTSPKSGPTNALEERLLEIWREVLVAPSIGIHDDFLSLGGDSILAMQIVARAHRWGLDLVPGELFTATTVAELARQARKNHKSVQVAEVASGIVPLTPIQQWFLSRGLEHSHHWNQAVLLDTEETLDPGRLEVAARALVEHHDALRLRFFCQGGSWLQEYRSMEEVAAAGPVSVSFDLAQVSQSEAPAAVERLCAGLQGSLDLERGILFRVAWIPRASGGQLLLVLHHLVVDGVSWRILLEDLESAYRHVDESGRSQPLPPRSSTYGSWAKYLRDWTQQTDLRGTVDAWTSLPWEGVEEIPTSSSRLAEEPAEAAGEISSGDLSSADVGARELLESSNRVGDARTVTRQLNRAGTRTLLTEMSRVFHTGALEVLLAALARTLGDWTGGDQVLVDLEGHGREDLGGGAVPDVSRTVGWFTSMFPVLLPVSDSDDPGQLLRGVKERLRSLPHKGASFGLLRFAHPDSAVRSQLENLPQAQVSFNYLGQFDSLISTSRFFAPSSLNSGPARDLRDPRQYVLEVDAWVEQGRLEMIWTYGGELHGEAEIEALADRFLNALGIFLDLDMNLSQGEFLASDYPLSQLPPTELETLVANEGGSFQVEDIFPLSHSQEGMLLYLLVHEGLPGAISEPLGGGSGRVFFNQLHCDLQGPLDEVVLRQVWQSMVNRHGALRTLIRWRGLSNPMQVVRARAELPWQSEDWRHLSSVAQQLELRSFLAADRARPFSLDQEPLLRISLIRLDEQRTRFVLSYHHLVLDGWSVSLLLKEAFSSYESRVVGSEPTLEPAPRFREYVAWQGQQDLAEAEIFWRQALEGVKAPASLRVGRSEGVAGGGDLRLRRKLERGLNTALKEAARRSRVTLNTVVQGAWALLLHELSSSEEVIFGSVVSGREMGFASTLGLFINALPVRTQIDRTAPADLWLQEMQESQLAQRRFEFCALEQIQRWSGLPREQALFETLIVFENYPVEEALLQGQAGLRAAGLEVEERTNYPLALFVFPGAELEFELNGDGGRFDTETAQLLMGRFCALLSRLAEQPAAALQSLLGPEEAERQQILGHWSRSDRSVAHSGGVHNLFEARAARDPAAPAILVPGDGVQPKEVISYGKLERRANQLAHELCSRGVGADTIVALRIPRSPELLVAVLAVLKAGGAYLPLDTGWPPSRCRWALEDSGASLLLSTAALPPLGDLPQSSPGVESLDLSELLGRGLRRWPTVPPHRRVARQSLAYLTYTSGSTGKPKGVMVEHGSLVVHALASAEEFNLHQRDRVLQFASLAFDASAEEIFPCWSRGAALVLRTDTMLDSAERFWTACSQWGITVADIPTSFWHRLIGDETAPARLPGQLRLVIIGGEKAKAEALETWRRRHRDGVKLLNTYGPTETTVAATCAVLSRPGLAEDDSSGMRETQGVPPEVSIGRPLAHAQVYVLDPHGEPVAMGIPGEICVAGSAPARGYIGRPAATAEAFRPDPFGAAAGGRCYRTGDIARWLERGELQFFGRRDTQLKIRGYRVEPLEIEATLEAHELVRAAAVALFREGGEDQLVAYITAHGKLETEVLRSFLREQFPEYMVPSVWVPLVNLPRTAGGKVDRGALPSPRFGQSSALESPAWQPPRNETEVAMADIFGDLLEVEQIGAFDHFFDLGGHSLLATRLVARVREIFEVDLPLRQVFESPTVAKLAAEVVSLILDQLENLSDDELDALN